MKRSLHSLFRKGTALLVMGALLALSLSGCASSDGRRGGGTTSGSVSDVMSSQMAIANSEQESAGDGASAQGSSEESGSSSAKEESGEVSVTLNGSGEIDVDLTIMSSTMVYSEVSNMMQYPEAYIGKTIKMDGSFNVIRDPNSGLYYFLCLIEDATACCAQGIEFELSGEYEYPEDYPEKSSEICVIGVFDTYQEGRYQYCTLRNARFA